MIIFILALGWHIFALLMDHIVSRRSGPSLEKTLKLIELDLTRKLERRLKELPKEKLEDYRNWLKESKNHLRGVEAYYE